MWSSGGRNYLLAGVPWTWLEAAAAGQVIIDPTISVGGGEDVWMEDTSNQNGQAAGLLAGSTGGAYPKKRTLIKFDLAAAGVPANATVLSARLRLNYYQSFTYGPPWLDRNLEAHQMLVNWAEAQATDSKRTATANWAAPLGQAGADYNSAIESSVLFTATTPMPSFQSWDLTALAQQWVNGAAANYGVILLADNENQIAHDLRFHSADSTPNSVNQPVLEVVWTQQQRSVYYLKDHLGSVRASVDDNGQLLSRDDYDPWGLQLAGRSMTVQPNLPNKFTGKERDIDFGLNWDYFGARPYDFEIGRWLVVDPVNSSPRLTPYNYTSNNPINRLDPDGQKDKPAMFWASVRVAKGFGSYIGGWTIIANAASAEAASGGTATPVVVPALLGGLGLKAWGFFEIGAGLRDFRFAASVPDGTDAKALGNLAKVIARGMGLGAFESELIAMLGDILTGGKGMVKGLSSDKLYKFLDSIATAKGLSQDIISTLEAARDQFPSDGDKQKNDNSDNKSESNNNPKFRRWVAEGVWQDTDGNYHLRGDNND